jgi:hypothetical protein
VTPLGWFLLGYWTARAIDQVLAAIALGDRLVVAVRENGGDE